MTSTAHGVPRHETAEMRRPETPNPGSEAARRAGCRCPVMDNNHGRWPPWHGDWWVTAGCPLHGGDE